MFWLHQDPDIVASVNEWLIGTECKIVAVVLQISPQAHFQIISGIEGDNFPHCPNGGINLERWENGKNRNKKGAARRLFWCDRD